MGLRKFAVRISLALALACSIMVPAVPVLAGTELLKPACQQGGTDASVCLTPNTNPLSSRDGIIRRVTSLVALVAGVAAVLTMVWAGIQYITSEGNPEEVSKAKKTIIFAVIGLLVIVLGQGIINFALRRI